MLRSVVVGLQFQAEMCWRWSASRLVGARRAVTLISLLRVCTVCNVPCTKSVDNQVLYHFVSEFCGFGTTSPIKVFWSIQTFIEVFAQSELHDPQT